MTKWEKLFFILASAGLAIALGAVGSSYQGWWSETTSSYVFWAGTAILVVGGLPFVGASVTTPGNPDYY